MPHLTRSRSGRAGETADEVDSSEPSSAGCLSGMALNPKHGENPASDKTASSQGTTSLGASTAEIKSKDKDEANKENMTQQVAQRNPATSNPPSSSIPKAKEECSIGASLAVRRQTENLDSETRPTPSSFSPPPSSARKPMHNSTTKISPLLPQSQGNTSIRSSSRDESRKYSGRQDGGERSGRSTEASPDDRSGHTSLNYSSASKAPYSSSREDRPRAHFRERGTPYGHPTEGGPRQPNHATLTNSHQIRSAPSSMLEAGTHRESSPSHRDHQPATKPRHSGRGSTRQPLQRETNSNTREMSREAAPSVGSIAAELDLAAKEDHEAAAKAIDEIYPLQDADYLDNMGSFDDEEHHTYTLPPTAMDEKENEKPAADMRRTKSTRDEISGRAKAPPSSSQKLSQGGPQGPPKPQAYPSSYQQQQTGQPGYGYRSSPHYMPGPPPPGYPMYQQYGQPGGPNPQHFYPPGAPPPPGFPGPYGSSYGHPPPGYPGGPHWGSFPQGYTGRPPQPAAHKDQGPKPFPEDTMKDPFRPREGERHDAGSKASKPYIGSPPLKKRGRAGMIRTMDSWGSPSGDLRKSPISKGTGKIHEGEICPLLEVSTPYRSPTRSGDRMMDERSSHKKYKRSPLFSDYSTFVVDTPGGQMDGTKLEAEHFSSPMMGPSFPDGFEDDGRTPSFPMAMDSDNSNEVPDLGGITFSRTGSRDSELGLDDGPPILPPPRRTTQFPHSPFSNFMGELSPLPSSMRYVDSPYERSSREYPAGAYTSSRAGYAPPIMGSPGLVERGSRTLPLMPSTGRVVGSGHHVLPSSPLTGSASKHQQWDGDQTPGASPASTAPYRLQIGSGGSRNSKGLQDINNVLRGGNGSSLAPRRSPPSSFPTPNSIGSSGRSSTGYAGDMRTPVKMSTPSGSGETPSFPGSASSHPSTRFPLQGLVTSTPISSRKSVGKENRRNPCNCKKSKCLKLYCECFAAELFCDGCNCLDCSNTAEYAPIREKAIKDTRAKNPNAFKAKIVPKSGVTNVSNTTPEAHNMGCRCKKSACLKKYCECFEAGVMCGKKCKCIECLNYVGSQPLIDRRRKIKDHKGAELAMKISDVAWKGMGSKQQDQKNKPTPRTPGIKTGNIVPMSSPSPHHRMVSMGGMTPSSYHPSPSIRGPPRPSPYVGHGGPPPRTVGFSPMGMVPPATPAYSSSSAMKRSMQKHRPGGPPKTVSGTFKSPITPDLTATPRAPAGRLCYDVQSSNKKKKMGLVTETQEVTAPFFGQKVSKQPKTAALGVFSFLSNDDLYNSSLVSKQWNKLALDKELWNY